MLQKKMDKLIELIQKIESILSNEETLQNINSPQDITPLEETLKDFFNKYIQTQNLLISIIQEKIGNYPIESNNLEFRILENLQNFNTIHTTIFYIVNNIKEFAKSNFPNKHKMINLQIGNLKKHKEHIIDLIQNITILTLDVKELIENFENPKNYD